MKTGAISYVIPQETPVAVVRLDNKVVGKIILYHRHSGSYYIYVPTGYGKGRRESLPMYSSFTACQRGIEGRDEWQQAEDTGTARTETESPAGEPETALASS